MPGDRAAIERLQADHVRPRMCPGSVIGRIAAAESGRVQALEPAARRLGQAVSDRPLVIDAVRSSSPVSAGGPGRAGAAQAFDLVWGEGFLRVRSNSRVPRS